MKPNLRNNFSYKNRSLYCENVPIEKIVRTHGTPVYIYSLNAIKYRASEYISNLKELSPSIYFAVKACSNIHILKELGHLNLGADIVSGGELFRASVAEISPQKIVYSGAAKSDHDLEIALKAGVGRIQAESLSELTAIDRISKKLGLKSDISLRINPSVSPKTHAHISTGSIDHKFGFSSIELKKTIHLYRNGFFKNLNFTGLSCHIGSQIHELKTFSLAWKRLVDVANAVPFKVKVLNLGGGLGVSYTDNEKSISIKSYCDLIIKTFKNLKYEIAIEPGRSIAGPSAVLVTKILRNRRGDKKQFYLIDAGMNDLIRPALYGARHKIIPIKKSVSKIQKVTVAGPVCETADTFLDDAKLPQINENSLLAITNAGAYGMSMSSQYNSRLRCAEVLVDGSNFSLIRSREIYADLIQRELI